MFGLPRLGLLGTLTVNFLLFFLYFTNIILNIKKAANAAFLTSENVLDLCGRYYDCKPPYKELKAIIQKDKEGSTSGANFLQSFGGKNCLNNHKRIKIFKTILN